MNYFILFLEILNTVGFKKIFIYNLIHILYKIFNLLFTFGNLVKKEEYRIIF